MSAPITVGVAASAKDKEGQVHQDGYSTTPGGTRIVYSRDALLNLANSPLSKTPPTHLPAIPGITDGLAQNNGKKHDSKRDGHGHGHTRSNSQGKGHQRSHSNSKSHLRKVDNATDWRQNAAPLPADESKADSNKDHGETFEMDI